MTMKTGNQDRAREAEYRLVIEAAPGARPRVRWRGVRWLQRVPLVNRLALWWALRVKR